MALLVVRNIIKGPLLLSVFLLSIVGSLADTNESYGPRDVVDNRVLKKSKATKSMKSSKDDKKKMKKKHKSETTPPETTPPVEPTVPGCYMAASVREAGYENGVCDCEMTEEACNAEEKTDRGFPIWTGGCYGLCMCPATGWGCYANEECDCEDAACEGGEELCVEMGKTWTNMCRSCQCASDLNTPSCNPNPKEPDTDDEPGNDDEPGPDDYACYIPADNACTCGDDYCTESDCTSLGGIWTTGCSCECPTEAPVEAPTTASPTSSAAPSVTKGCGCYSIGACDCEVCDQSECEAISDTFWIGGCESCQCPDLVNGVDCPVLSF